MIEVLLGWVIGIATGWKVKGHSMMVSVIRLSGSTGGETTINDFWPEGFYSWSNTNTGAIR